ncbi:MAG TPA: DUF885 family protein [Acidisarcina sp.]|nr:DUF885 family protein [Acidisarcina sp.]
MTKSKILALLLVASTLIPSSLLFGQGQSVEGRRKALNAVLSDVWEDRLRTSPEFASSIGDSRYNDQLSDYSIKAYNENLARGRAYLLRLSEIDTTGLTDQEKLSSDLMVRDLVNEQDEARFKPWQMPLNQFSGLHTELPQLVDQLSFKTVKDYDDWIARLHKMPAALQQITDNMSLGMEEHRMPPKYLLEKVLVQVNTIAALKPADSPFARPIKKFPATISAREQERISQETLDAVSHDVLPAYARLSRFLEHQYIPQGRTEPGVWSLPDGDTYYAFAVRRSTTTSLTPEQIHEIGLAEVKRDEEEMLAIAKKLGFNDLKSMQAAIARNPKLHPASKEALLAAYQGHLDQMKPRLPELFGRLPKAPLIVEATPSYMEKDQAAAYYLHGTADGSRPGKVVVNTYNATSRSLADVEAIAYHEGLPGHHLQISIAQELQGLPEFRKHTYFTAYTEGWGLYAERLGKDVGFYQDPYSDYGRLETDIWRAIRLVVDTGVHSKHWTRDQMVDYFRQHSAIDETNIQAETDRYIAWPGQALGYKIGQLKLLSLRAKAHEALGPKFDIRAFHDEVLDSGALPLDLLEARVTAWIAQQKAAK